MKTTTEQFTAFGNTGIVQIRALPLSEFRFSPGGPMIKKGGLVITEAMESGVVGRLAAYNGTDEYLLLTDADVLTGARQNRIVNKSVLLAPGTKTIIDVSCIERLRWSYNSRNFSSPGTTADHDLRRAKAAAMSPGKRRRPEGIDETQGIVWSHINERMAEANYSSGTESYEELVKYSLSKRNASFPECNAEAGCNGMAVVTGGKVQSIDIFGTEEVYQYYFPLLRDAAFRIARKGKDVKEAEKHESYYRVLETLDSFEAAEKNPDETYTGIGRMSVCEKDVVIGFELAMEGQPVHTTVFGRQES